MTLVLTPASSSLAHPSRDVGTLLAKAQAQGTVRVIVGVRTNFTPEGRLPVTAAQTQRAQIAQAQDTLLTQLPASSVRASRKFEFIPYLVLETDATGLAFLASAPNVTSIGEDKLRKPSLAESTALIGATNAWASGYSGAGWTVAILDTGVDKTHPFLSGKVVSEACYSTNTSGTGYTSTTVCPGGVEASTTVGSGVNCNLTIEGCDHGTHVAGIAAGKGASFSGVARDANVIAIQVFSRFDSVTYCGSSLPCALSWDSDQISALQRVYNLRAVYNIASVNLSLGGGSYSSYCDDDPDIVPYKAAVDNLRSVDIATVIASGNESYTNSMGAPACISTAISVGSTTDGGSGASPADQVSSFSNSTSFLNLLAPGQYIYSSVPGGSYGNWAGTSMATPHVTGAWAVLKSRKPSATVTEVLNALTATGVSVTDLRNTITKPRIRVDSAMNYLVPPLPPVPSTHFFPFINKTTSVTSGWVTMLNTTFESDFPGSWWVVDGDGATNGEYYWGARGCRSFSGSYSGWAIGAGTNGGSLGCGSNYPSNNTAWMIYGPFDLSNTTAAELRARIWTQTELSYDTLCMAASTNSSNFYGMCYSGTFNWEEKTLNLANVDTLGSLLGQPNVSVAFRFYSDYSYTYPEGAYVDDIVLRKCPSGTNCPAGAAPAATKSNGVAKPGSFVRPK